MARVLGRSRTRCQSGPRRAAARAGRRRGAGSGRRSRSGFALRGAAPGHDLALGEQGQRDPARRPPAGPARRARQPHRPRRLAAGRRGPVGAVEAAARPDDPVPAGLARRGGGPVRRARARRGGAHPSGRSGAGQCPPGPGAGRRRDRLPARALRRTRARSVGRRTDDVRAGQLRALPAQDLQCLVDRGRRGPAALAVRDDPQHPRAHAAVHALGLQRQRGGGGGLSGPPLPARSGHQPVPQRAAARQRVLHQGRDPQPPDRDLPVLGRQYRCRRRDPRRGRHRPRRQAQGRPDRFQRLAPAHSHAAPALGGRAQPQPAHGAGAGDHARRAAGRGRVQQRVRPAQPAGLFPQLRARPRGRAGARLRQADHAGRRPRRDGPVDGGQAPPAARRRGGGAGRPGHAHRPGRRRRQFRGIGRERRGPGFRLGAAREPGDGAALPGSHRQLRGAGRGQSDRLDPRRRRRGPVQCDPRTAARLGRGRADRPGPGADRRPLALADAAVVQRIAGALRAGRAAGAAGRVRGAVRARALPVLRRGRGNRGAAPGGGVWRPRC